MRMRAVVPAVVACLLLTAEAEAQARQQRQGAGPPPAEDRLRFGAQLSYADDAKLGVGVRVVWPLSGLGPVDLITTADYFFPPSTEGATAVERKYSEVNLSLAYRFGRHLQPYAGAGLNMARRKATLTFLGREAVTSDTSVGLNVLAGARWPLGRNLRMFAEARVEIEGGEQKLISAGILF